MMMTMIPFNSPALVLRLILALAPILAQRTRQAQRGNVPHMVLQWLPPPVIARLRLAQTHLRYHCPRVQAG